MTSISRRSFRLCHSSHLLLSRRYLYAVPALRSVRLSPRIASIWQSRTYGNPSIPLVLGCSPALHRWPHHGLTRSNPRRAHRWPHHRQMPPNPGRARRQHISATPPPGPRHDTPLPRGPLLQVSPCMQRPLYPAPLASPPRHTLSWSSPTLSTSCSICLPPDFFSLIHVTPCQRHTPSYPTFTSNGLPCRMWISRHLEILIPTWPRPPFNLHASASSWRPSFIFAYTFLP